MAFHEAAHVVAAFHWDVPIGEDGVFVLPDSGHGYAGALWDRSPLSGSHEENVGTLLGPFAEYEYFKRYGIAVDDEKFFLGCKKDFPFILKTPELSSFVDALAEVPTGNPLQWGFSRFAEKEFGFRCLSLWREQRSANPGEEALAKLVSDTDRMLRAYWQQIAALAERLLCAEGYRLSAFEVNAWRSNRFRRCNP